MKTFPTPVLPADAKATAAESVIATIDGAYKAADSALATRVGTAEKAIADNKTAADTVIAAVKTTADKATTDLAALTTTVAGNKTAVDTAISNETTARTNADKAISDAATALTTRVTTAEGEIVANKAAADSAIASAIADWNDKRPYVAGNKVMVGTAFFKALKSSTGVNPTTDNAGNWGIFNPGSENDVFANRSPVKTDVKPAGVKWWDVSFGADTPLGFLSLSNGAWQPLNAITLSRIRFIGNGVKATYRSSIWNIRFFSADGSQIPNSHFIWGNASGISGPKAGVAYSGQSISGGYNVSGWAEIECGSAFDSSVSISKILGNMTYMNCSQVQFFYSNGSSKTYTSYGNIDSGNAEVTLATCDPVLPCRFGDAIAAALGETLTAAKLSDAASTTAGRVTGAEFVSAWNALYEQQPA
ncbi:MAG: hypothetical protein ACRC62_33555, partial [Microcoleus sp.]